MGILLLYDVTNAKSLQNVRNWVRRGLRRSGEMLGRCGGDMGAPWPEEIGGDVEEMRIWVRRGLRRGRGERGEESADAIRAPRL